MMFNKLHGKYSNYHYCIVQECKNTSIKTPDKLWIRVPTDKNKRHTWLNAANRDPLTLSTDTQLYFCEDHFDLENDMENYMEYKLMGSVKRIRMKPDSIPSRFECQSERKRKLTPTPDKMKHTSKKRVLMLTMGDNKQDCPIEISTSSFHQELLNKENIRPSCSSSHLYKIHDEAVQVVQHNAQFREQASQIQPVQRDVSCQVVQHNAQFREQASQIQPVHRDVSCQVIQHYAHKVTQASITKHYRSKQVQSSVTVKDAVSSPIKLVQRTTATSPNKSSEGRYIKPSTSDQSQSKVMSSFANEDMSRHDSDVSYTLSQGESLIESSPSKPSSQTTTDSSQEKNIKDQQLNLQSTLSKIRLNPRLYIGISAELYFMVGIIAKRANLSEKHILLCLMKIRLNRTFSQLADDFDVSLSQASKIFYSKIYLIVSVLSPFVKTFTSSTIKKNLPIAFRHKYHKVNCIIDCLEIEIQKPKIAIHQALSWSEYKKANTFKYLIACTPDGLVSFVSGGYGGRISDVNLLEHSKFLDSLEPRSCILADRGFKHIEMYLKQRGFTLLRPPSVAGGSKMTKSEAKLTKEIASLRILVERVIRRIREFSLLKPHSVVNLNLISVLDFCVVIACALINLQDSLIK